MDPSKIDERFQAVFQDHRFRSIKQKQRKVKIDRRFQSMFTDDKFKLQYTTDKRGKPIHETASENLKKYYRLSNKEKRRLKLQRQKERNRLSNLLNDGKNEEKFSNNNREADGKEDCDDSDIQDESSESSDEYVSSDEDSDVDSGPDLARGEGNVETSSDEEQDEDVDMHPQFDHRWGELDAEAVRSEEVSKRLALCNMDWDRIRAVDLLVLLNSFKPVAGKVKRVVIYPSEYGIKRLKREYIDGPSELQDAAENIEANNVERYQTEKLREHQINRLKYYYAVIECDSEGTADTIYKECDGMEYESSSSKLDLRFIPDDVTFNDHPPKDVADHLPDKDLYKPSNFVTTALNQAKVNLTWDETDHRRLKMTMRKFTEDDLTAIDMNDFLASSSGEEELEEGPVQQNSNRNEKVVDRIALSSKTTDQDQIERYRSLLLGDGDDKDDKPDDVHMEITWEPDLDEMKEDGDDDDEEESDDDDDEDHDDSDVSRKSAESGNENESEQDASQESEKKRAGKRKGVDEPEVLDPQKKAELEMLMMDSEDEKKKHFDMKNILKEQHMSNKKRRKLGIEKQEDSFKIDINDSRFSALYTSAAFALDPNNPSYRKTKGMKELLEERQDRMRKSRDTEDKNLEKTSESIEKVSSNDTDISKLVASIKSKTKTRFSKTKGKSPAKSNEQ